MANEHEKALEEDMANEHEKALEATCSGIHCHKRHLGEEDAV